MQQQETVIRQVRLGFDTIRSLKLFTIDHDTTQRQLVNDALQWFLEQRESKDQVDYLPSPKEGKKVSLYIKKALAEDTRQLAERDRTYQNRVLYTGLLLYLKHAQTIYTEQ